MINQSAIGAFIAERRREQNLTQEQLAEKIGVSNKTVSKWECGKSLPDYSTIQPLCEQLGVSINELMNAELREEHSIRVCSEQEALEDMRKARKQELARTSMIALIFLFASCALCLLVSNLVGGSDVTDFISGVLTGVGSGGLVIGVVCALLVVVRDVVQR